MMKDSIGQQLVSSSKTKLEYLNTGAIPTIKDHSHMRTIFKRLLLFIWKSSISCQLGAAIPWVEGEIIFKDDQRVSIISPSTLPTPGMKLGEYLMKHSN